MSNQVRRRVGRIIDLPSCELSVRRRRSGGRFPGRNVVSREIPGGRRGPGVGRRPRHVAVRVGRVGLRRGVRGGGGGGDRRPGARPGREPHRHGRGLRRRAVGDHRRPGDHRAGGTRRSWPPRCGRWRRWRRWWRRHGRRSAGRLGVDAIDLYQVHWPNPLVPLGSTMAGMRRLVDAGVVRHVGVSNFSLGPVAGGGAAAGGAGAVEPGPLQPGGPQAGAGAAVVRGGGGPAGDRLQPAGPGPAGRAVRRVAPADVDDPQGQPQLFMPENLRRVAPLLAVAAGGGRRPRRHARPRWRWRGSCVAPTRSSSPARGPSSNSNPTSPPPTSTSPTTRTPG